MASVLLRRLYTTSFEEFWTEFPPDVQATVKQEMLLSVQLEQNATIRKKVCECVAEFARNMLGRRSFVMADFTNTVTCKMIYGYIVVSSGRTWNQSISKWQILVSLGSVKKKRLKVC